MSSFDRMIEWLPDTRREWIEVIIAAALLGLLMVTTIAELEVRRRPWRDARICDGEVSF